MKKMTLAIAVAALALTGCSGNGPFSSDSSSDILRGFKPKAGQVIPLENGGSIVVNPDGSYQLFPPPFVIGGPVPPAPTISVKPQTEK